ncbi:MAG: VWA domain-containing protein [Candidatus Aminicenantes bacterium]|nr:VWA domain-containing protein [Candidatus Aminicenantes bacterium]
MKKRTILLILILSLFFQTKAFTSKPDSSQAKKDQKALQHEVTVTLKLVQVYVTDKKGDPITDLTKADFILYDNGKLQAITDFEKHNLALPVKKTEKKIEEKLEETELAPSKKIPSRMNRKFILLLDIDSNDLLGVAKSKKAAFHFIETQLQPSDEIGIFSYSPLKGLIVHEYLTSDHKKVIEAIKSIKDVPGVVDEEGGGMTLMQERMRAEAEAGLGSESSTTTGMTRNVDPEIEFLKYKANNFIDGIKELAKSLRYIPGYKNIILFSAGIKKELFYERDDPRLRSKFEDMSKELASSSSPVHAVYTEGSRYLLKKNPVVGMDSLKMLSKISGGKYFNDVVHHEEISKEIQNSTSNYYVLGYYINDKWDGKYHEVKVKVERKGYQVHAQAGYFNSKPFSEFSEFEKRLHLIDLAMSDTPYFQELTRFSLISLHCSQKNESNFVLLSEISLERIKEIIRGKTELVTLIFDSENKIADSYQGEVNFSLIPKKKVYYYSIFSLQPGQYECRVVLRNLETGKGAVASSSVKIPEEIDSGIRIYPPLLLIPERKAFYLKALKTQKEKAEKEPLSLINIYPFLSNEHSPLLEELDRSVSRLLAVVRSSIINIKEPDIELTAHLIQHSSGQKTDLSVFILSAENREEVDILLIELELPEMEPGRYSLEIEAEELFTKSKSQVTRSFIIK